MALHRQDRTVLEAREWCADGSLFAIVDACDAPMVLAHVRTLGETRAVSLYRGSAEDVYESIAPYLLQVDAETFDWIVDTLWADPWGIFVRSDASFAHLRTHFRKFLMVESPSGEEWYFRFYDPRVVSVFLSTCTTDELSTFFGPADMIAIVDEDTLGVMAFAPERVPG